MIDYVPTVFWLTGLSGSGKTTLGTLLTNKLRSRGNSVIFLDGDTLREVYDNNFGYDRHGRFTASLQYARLCKMLTEQNVHVVCATISMFHHTQDWNRKNIANYMEIFMDVPLSELIKRDNKKIYSRCLSGELNNVVGIDIVPEFPKTPDIIIRNPHESFIENNVDLILEKLDSKVCVNQEVINHAN